MRGQSRACAQRRRHEGTSALWKDVKRLRLYSDSFIRLTEPHRARFRLKGRYGARGVTDLGCPWGLHQLSSAHPSLIGHCTLPAPRASRRSVRRGGPVGEASLAAGCKGHTSKEGLVFKVLTYESVCEMGSSPLLLRSNARATAGARRMKGTLFASAFLGILRCSSLCAAGEVRAKGTLLTSPSLVGKLLQLLLDFLLACSASRMGLVSGFLTACAI